MWSSLDQNGVTKRRGIYLLSIFSQLCAGLAPPLQIAPDCTEMANGHGSPNGLKDPENSDENGASRATLHPSESNCTDECARGDSNSHPLRDWILSPARLPIPPLALRLSRLPATRTSSSAFVGAAFLGWEL